MVDEPLSRDTTHEKELITPHTRSNYFCWLSGVLILLANKVRHSIQGYMTPRTFPISDFDRAIDYDLSVVNSWRHYLNEYTGLDNQLQGMNILELGPGADLGIGLLLLANGANKYCSLDVNNLVASVPDGFYERLLNRIESDQLGTASTTELQDELSLTSAGNNNRLNYVCDTDFDITRFDNEEINLVFSQAAFEHFDDIPGTFSQLTSIVRPGGILIAEVDLSTHTRWIRDFDPLNIYRYSETFYNVSRFPGSPNRVRPYEYKQILKSLGWKDVRVIPRKVTDDGYANRAGNHLAARFREPKEEIGMLSIILCATL